MDFMNQNLYGNEWIDVSKSYKKFTIENDGIYRISYNELIEAGLPLDINGNQIQIYSFGQLVPIFTTTTDAFTSSDYVEFFGEQNKGELDKPLFHEAENQLNPELSMFTSKRAYYLTWDINSDGNPNVEEVENNLNGDLPLVEKYYIETELKVFDDRAIKHIYNSEYVRYSQFYKTEGFGTQQRKFNEVEFKVTDLNNFGPAPVLKFRAGLNFSPHITEISFNQDKLDNVTTIGYSVTDYEYSFKIQDLKETNKLVVEGVFDDKDILSIAHASLSYPRKFRANGRNNMLLGFQKSSFQRYIELEDFESENQTVFAYDVVNNERLVVESENGLQKFVLDPTANERKLYIYTEALQIEEFLEVEFVDYLAASPDYVILTSKALDKTDANGDNWIQNYADYRRETTNGDFDVTVVHYEDLVDQFGYGIVENPLALNNWAMYLKDRWTNWQYIFIIGKAYEYPYMRQNVSLSSMVPTYGSPGSDNLLFAERGKAYPILPLGRLAAKTTEDVKVYLNKIIQYSNSKLSEQSIEGRLWMKKIIHLSGGGSTLQSGLVSKYLNTMGDLMSETKFGPEISKYEKNTKDPIESSVSEEIVKDIDEGAALVTFFGHSTVGSFDYSIEDPSKWNNGDKLPFIYSMGCHSGNIHTREQGISEEFVLYPESGSIGFYATSSTAFINPQFLQGKGMYKYLGDELYGKPISHAIQATLKETFVDTSGMHLPPSLYFSNQYTSVVTLTEQMTFHGDPYINIYAQEGPDYIPSLQGIKTTPELISTNIEEVLFEFDVYNLGYYVEDSLDIGVIHYYDEQSDTILTTIATPLNLSHVEVMIPMKGLESTGKNVVDIIVDINNKIEEFPTSNGESNNSLRQAYQMDGYEFFVSSYNPIPFYPSEFSIKNTQNIILKASTGNAFVESDQYKLQIDTTELFDSPLLKEEIVQSNGGIIQWDPNLSYTNERVYYWRVQAQNSDLDKNIWSGSSFMYHDQLEEGWNQSHLYQYLRDDLTTLQIDARTQDFEYIQKIDELKIINPNKINGFNYIQVNYNGSLTAAGYNVDSLGMMVVVVDPISNEFLTCPRNGTFGADNRLATVDQKAWIFSMHTSSEQQEFVNFISNEVPDDYFVVIIANQNSNFLSPEAWGDSVFAIMEGQGANLVRDLASKARPYILAYRKNSGMLFEEISEEENPQSIEGQVELKGHWYEGGIKSTLIGPVKEWHNITWNMSNFSASEDQFRISVLGISENGSEDTIASELLTQDFDLSHVDPQKYPQIRLEYFSKDLRSRTSPDLDFWRVHYSSLPDALLLKDDRYIYHADTISEGDLLKLNYTIKNISDSNMDSILVQYIITSLNQKSDTIKARYAPLPTNGVIEVEFDLETIEKKGLYELKIELNPAEDQKESYYFNNTAFLRFYVQHDILNPLLDVTFDGLRIMDGDIIAPSPLIKIDLTDENPFFTLEDPDDFIIQLSHPNGNEEELDMSDDLIQFIPSYVHGSPASIEYKPSLDNGIYQLKVQGKDASGNLSGDHPYTINFEVINETLVSNVLTYPNPFSTQTQFIFTLTGNQVPEDYHIKIMTISGKLVKEITKEDLGPVRIGKNRTDYAWDGRDEYGEKLANGVYIYKLYTDIDDQYETLDLGNLNQHFKKGFGKLVIMR